MISLIEIVSSKILVLKFGYQFLLLAIEGENFSILLLDEKGKMTSKKVFPNDLSSFGDIISLKEKNDSQIMIAVNAGNEDTKIFHFTLKLENDLIFLEQNGIDVDQINFSSNTNGHSYNVMDSSLELSNKIKDFHFLENSKELLEKLKTSKKKSIDSEKLQNSFAELLLQALNSSDKNLIDEIFEIEVIPFISLTKGH